MAPSNSSAQPAVWEAQSPQLAGFAPDLSSRLDALIGDKRIWNVHGVVVARGGKLVLERYFDGTDWARGRSLGTVVFGPDTLHDLRSVSKSIVGLLYGVALAEGKVPPPEAPLLAAFPAYRDLAADPARAKWTVHHALTMTMGTDWDELSVPYSDPTNSEIEMDGASDRYRYVLGRPVVFEPGTRWVYSGGATALLGRMITQGTGKSLHAFARETLFDPLGMGPSEWLTDARGDEFAASGLRLRPRDLARIGQLVLQGGEVDGRQIVLREWIARATRLYVSCDEVRRYGYQWYMGDMTFSVTSGPRWNRNRLERYQGAYGNGGQRLWVFPGLDLVVAVTAGNYDTPDQWVPSLRVLREAVLASVL
ncbi:serine hydrolase domain-containing protein [Reyranella sp.]|uniref:serine hydrolase domain-containing protein n=1 Tax=Reyranella sp. TaxID=1929291 RepID=UPI003C7D2F5B